MKRIFLILGILFTMTLSFTNCASSNRAGDDAEESEDYAAEYNDAQSEEDLP
jgi:hypothetical protein